MLAGALESVSSSALRARRIDAAGAAGRDPAGEEGDREEHRVCRAEHPRHCRCKAESLFRHFQIRRLDFVADAVSPGCDSGKACRATIGEGIKQCIARE
jgi:hypothetical protein